MVDYTIEIRMVPKLIVRIFPIPHIQVTRRLADCRMHQLGPSPRPSTFRTRTNNILILYLHLMLSMVNRSLIFLTFPHEYVPLATRFF
jgi:hypothetical protein